MWEEVALNTCIQIHEQSFWGETGSKEETPQVLSREVRLTHSCCCRGDSEKQCLLLYLRPSQLKHGFSPHLD